ncbi:FHA domain-containing protein [Myxococcus sp. CA051A]|uniref:FHA domain-containing protein n=1 Tax=unclassified Myxococcus TaxID=2648731 RepID=UPI00157B4CB2|nr:MULTISPECIES: FHA domain-containing protein [unclassified Myxococcus]NTX13297.1 FHA domain-containing protein [Myxococcus sp. CA056]NTX36251.1 FHA domain-containing protein [Myxococcus sp. CA033]NTX53041.1 FHA domain-containing protein [Myxococcus sp. CA039A]NTX61757.1 FHA domain-containing protein [Myxococcus sp. CA051A]
MRFEFQHLGTTTPFELPEGHHLLGGGPDDHIRLESLPPKLLTLRIEGSQLMVEATRTFNVNGVLVPPGVSRLVLPGEVLGLPDTMLLSVLPEAPMERGLGTVAVLKGLLTGLDAPAPSRAATLTCLTGLDVGRTHALAEARTRLGRGQEATLRLRDRAVSRSHACILHDEDEGTFTLEDLGSPNGVFVNGQRVREQVPLSDGDVLELGRTLLRFQAPLEELAPDSVASEPPSRPPEGIVEVPTPDGEGAEAKGPSEARPTVRRAHAEWWLIGLGGAAALAGLLVTYVLATG